MRNATYLSLSRHGICYFRWPIPSTANQHGKASHICISLRTRLPQVAQRLLRALIVSGQAATNQQTVQAMRCDEMRQHVGPRFRAVLQKYKDRLLSDGDGPVNGRTPGGAQ